MRENRTIFHINALIDVKHFTRIAKEASSLGILLLIWDSIRNEYKSQNEITVSYQKYMEKENESCQSVRGESRYVLLVYQKTDSFVKWNKASELLKSCNLQPRTITLEY